MELEWHRRMARELEFRELLKEAVCTGLKNVLGESQCDTVWFYLKKRSSTIQDEIACNPAVLSEGLEKIFGAGAVVLENHVVKALFSRLDLGGLDVKNQGFIDQVKMAEKLYRSE